MDYESFNYEEDLHHREDEELLEDLEEDFQVTEGNCGSADLINQDYNLDSPLNPEFITELLNHLRFKKPAQCFRSKINSESIVVYKFLGLEKVSRMQLNHPFHSKVIERIRADQEISLGLRNGLSETLLDDILSDICAISDKTFGRETTCKERLIMRNSLMSTLSTPSSIGKCKSDFSKWHYLDSLVKLRNYFKTNQTIQGSNHLLFQVVEQLQDNVLRVEGGIAFSNFLIFPETYYSVEQNFLFTHNELLMMKDLFFSRWISKEIIKINLSEKYSETLLCDWEKIVKAGDDLISILGNPAYDHLKMLESFCSLRWLELSEDEEFIPLTQTLKTHVNNTVEEASKIHPIISQFYQTLMNTLSGIQNPDDISIIFGSFRIWGHPYIEVEDGLKSLKELVRREVEVDTDYANRLASDLVKKCLSAHFKKTGTWGVDITKLDPKHPLYDFIKNNVWPTRDFVNNSGDRWNELPLTKIFDIPDDINLSTLYADKSHSGTRQEVYEEYLRKPNDPIKSRKVLETLLDRKVMSPSEFLEDIAENGLDSDDLIIGLREKEREMKRKGRFFTLMSWKLREYIVLTEYLIKIHFLPLFSGITMADGLTTIVKKIIKLTKGQSGLRRKLIAIANHIDYEKWNNLQRHKSVGPIFKAMDAMLGFKGPVIERTHPFFQKMLVYFAGRLDKLELFKTNEGNIIANESKTSFAWNGQDGGFEGLRQKGWTVGGALLIERESKQNNVDVSILAQGDNQVIKIAFKVDPMRPLSDVADEVIKINNRIMNRILKGAERLGLSINRDETMSSSRFLIYGKIPVYRGNFLNLENKKWSRATSVSNDQIPTSSNIMGAISTTAIGSLQFEEDILGTFFLFNLVGLLSMKNALTNNAITNQQITDISRLSRNDLLYWLYLDKSIGGFTGMSPSRLLIRQFPDPVTESLSFWLKMSSISRFKENLSVVLNPKFSKKLNIESLIENPTGLNIVSASSIENKIKEEVKKALVSNIGNIKNQYIKSALEYNNKCKDAFIAYLISIEPCFPRFLSEFKESSEVGLADTIVGLIQNSRTIRNLFKKKFSQRIKTVVKQGESFSLKSWLDLNKKGNKGPTSPIFRCSSEIADRFRHIGWRRLIVGVTVPHPLEYLEYVNIRKNQDRTIICGSIQNTPIKPRYFIGPLNPYLGSKTSETTSVINHWEREVKNPLSKKAFNLLRAVNWFVRADSNLGRSVIQNAENMIGGSEIKLFSGLGKRTGTAIHRFSSSRVSNGGFISMSPNVPRWMYVTAENLKDIREKNYDFMYQSTMIHAQAQFCWSIKSKKQLIGEYRWCCDKCLREVDEIFLESRNSFSIQNMTREFGVKSVIRPTIFVSEMDTSSLVERHDSNSKISHLDYHIGFNIAILFAVKELTGLNEEQDASIFSNTLKKKIDPEPFFEGFIEGLRSASVIGVLRRYRKSGRMYPEGIVRGTVAFLIGKLRGNNHAMAMFDSTNLRQFLIKVSGYVPPSFPTSDSDMHNLIEKTCNKINYKLKWEEFLCKKNFTVFSDSISAISVTLIILSHRLLPMIFSKKQNLAAINKELFNQKTILHSVQTGANPAKALMDKKRCKIKLVDSEIRHALSHRQDTFDNSGIGLEWTFEPSIKCTKLDVTFSDREVELKDLSFLEKKENPVISGLRLNRLPTGAHYKIRSLIELVNKESARIILSIGDGSGGCGSAILRKVKNVEVIHNSLLITPTMTNGVSPQVPSGYSILPEEDLNRLINKDDYWKHETDLSNYKTWEVFLALLRERNSPNIGIFCDAEVVDDVTQSLIEKNLMVFINMYGKPPVWVIWKAYDDRLLKKKVPQHLSHYWSNSLVKTELTSGYSYESYLVSQDQCSKSDDKKIYFDESTLLKIRTGVKMSMDTKLLFDRTIRIYQDKTLHDGIPSQLNQDPIMTICDIFYNLGLSSQLLNQIVGDGSMDGDNLVKLLNAFLKEVFNLTKRVPENLIGTLLPRPTRVAQLGVIWYSLFTVNSIQENDYSDFLTGEKILNEGLTIGMSMIKVKGGFKLVILRSLIRTDVENYYRVSLEKELGSTFIRCILRAEYSKKKKQSIKPSLDFIGKIFNSAKVEIGKLPGSSDAHEVTVMADSESDDDMEGQL